MSEGMRNDTSAAAPSVRYLRQGIELLRRLDDTTYADLGASPFPGGVGAQLRHCIDFFDCFLASLDDGRVDYTRRRRDPRLERDRGHAESRMRALADALAALDPSASDRELLVRSEEAENERWTRSTVRRELDFLVSHTIHHYALIVALLRLGGHAVPAELDGFGVAPSTLRHWRESGAGPR
jgi:uncharacterized damage-inducible protein DinB